jgi:hypothetical protein
MTDAEIINLLPHTSIPMPTKQSFRINLGDHNILSVDIIAIIKYIMPERIQNTPMPKGGLKYHFVSKIAIFSHAGTALLKIDHSFAGSRTSILFGSHQRANLTGSHHCVKYPLKPSLKK